MHSEILKLPCGLPSEPILYICGSVLLANNSSTSSLKRWTLIAVLN